MLILTFDSVMFIARCPLLASLRLLTHVHVPSSVDAGCIAAAYHLTAQCVTSLLHGTLWLEGRGTGRQLVHGKEPRRAQVIQQYLHLRHRRSSGRLSQIVPPPTQPVHRARHHSLALQIGAVQAKLSFDSTIS